MNFLSVLSNNRQEMMHRPQGKAACAYRNVLQDVLSHMFSTYTSDSVSVAHGNSFD